jgi:hypothetical protein
VERLVLRRIVLLEAPLALALLEIFHPEQPSGASGAVEQGEWFMWFHIIQVPLIGLIALAIYLLTEGLEGRAVSVSRWAIGVFAVFFSAYDAAAGIDPQGTLAFGCFFLGAAWLELAPGRLTSASGPSRVS